MSKQERFYTPSESWHLLSPENVRLYLGEEFRRVSDGMFRQFQTLMDENSELKKRIEVLEGNND